MQEPAEVLARAIAAQLTAPAPAAVDHFVIRLNLRERGAAPREIDVDVLYDAGDGGRLLLVLDDSAHGGVRVEKGFQDGRYWLRQQDEEPIDLVGRDYARDREAIDQGLELCEQLLLLFDLEQLRARAQDLTLEDATLARGGEEQPHAVLRGSILLGDRPRRFALWIERASWLPSRLTLELPPAPAADGVEPAAPAAPVLQEFDLRGWHDFPVHERDMAQGRLVPRLVTEFHRAPGGAREEVRILELHDVQWRLRPRFPELQRR